MTAAPEPWGPWAPDLDAAERLARFRSLRTLVQVFAGPDHALVAALANAEIDPAAANAAWEALSTTPSLTRRRVLSTFAAIHRPKRGAL